MQHGVHARTLQLQHTHRHRQELQNYTYVLSHVHAKSQLWSNQPLKRRKWAWLSKHNSLLAHRVISSKIHAIRHHHRTDHRLKERLNLVSQLTVDGDVSTVPLSLWSSLLKITYANTLTLSNFAHRLPYSDQAGKSARGDCGSRGERDETAGEKCKVHCELCLIRGKWLLDA